ncbi:MAG: DNA polymerase thumb domain-containing protein [Planctomycetota bacterium]
MRPLFIHVDIDAFFASVEQLLDPRLRGRPVAVGSGVVASASYEARARGLHNGMPLHQARRLCPDLTVLPGRHDVYRCFTDALWDLLRRLAPAVETHLDEAFADFSGTERAFPDPWALARDLKEAAFRETGLRVTVGAARTRLLAKLAAQSVKPDGLRVLAPGEEDSFLLPLPVEALPGVGPRTAELFGDLNLRTVADLRALPRETLRRLLGRPGEVLYDRARGLDTRPLRAGEIPRSVSRETSLESPSADPAVLEPLLSYLLDRALGALRRAGLRARTLTVRLGYADGPQEEVSETAGPTAGAAELQPRARVLLGRLHRRRVALRRLGVVLSNLVLESGQLELFGDPRRRALEAAVDAVRRRYGHGAIVAGRAIALLGRLPHDAAGYVLRTPSLTQ